MHRHRHGEVGLAGARRAYGKDHFVAAERFQIGALGGVAGGDGLFRQGEHGFVAERAPQVRTGIAFEELEPLFEIGALERVPAAQQAVELGEQIQDAFAQLRIVGGYGEGGSPCGEIGPGTFRDGVEVGVVRSEQGVCQCRIIEGKGFHEGRWRCGFLHRFGRRRGRRGTVCRVRREQRFGGGEKALPGNAAFPSVASGAQGRPQPIAFAA